jgi:hypothetical protein
VNSSSACLAGDQLACGLTQVHARVAGEGNGAGRADCTDGDARADGLQSAGLRRWSLALITGTCEQAVAPAQSWIGSDTIEVMTVRNRSRSDSAVYGERLTRIAPPVSRIPSALVSSHA